MRYNTKLFFAKVLILVLLTACLPPDANLEDNHQSLSITPEQAYFDTSNRADFILDLFPKENSKFSYAFYHAKSGAINLVVEDAEKIGYESSICIDPYFPVLIQRGDNWQINDMMERMRLVVNEKEIKDVVASGNTVSASLADIPDTEWVDGASYCWLVPLEVGTHQAEFSFMQSPGDVKSYSWQFEIIP